LLPEECPVRFPCFNHAPEPVSGQVNYCPWKRRAIIARTPRAFCAASPFYGSRWTFVYGCRLHFAPLI